MTRRLEPQDLYAIKLVEDPQITPDGERIAYLVAEIDRESYEYHRSIWVADVASTELHRYTAGNNDRSPRWSPDGRSLAFVRGPAGEVKPKNKEERDRGVGKAQLWVLPADGGEARQLTWLRDGAGEPTWSPDGATIAFSAEVGQPDDVEAADAQLEEKKVPAVRTIDRLWNRLDGKGWIYERRSHLFRIPSSGGDLEQLTDGDWDDGSPAFSPDGQRIAFTSDRAEERWSWPGKDIWVLDLRSKRLTRMSDETIYAGPPAWSPDGRQLAFTASKRRHADGYDDLLVVDVSAPGTARRLTEGFAPTFADTSIDDQRADHGGDDVRVDQLLAEAPLVAVGVVELLERLAAPVLADREVDADRRLGELAGADLVGVGARLDAQPALKAAALVQRQHQRRLVVDDPAARQLQQVLQGRVQPQGLGDDLVVVAREGEVEGEQHVHRLAVERLEADVRRRHVQDALVVVVRGLDLGRVDVAAAQAAGLQRGPAVAALFAVLLQHELAAVAVVEVAHLRERLAQAVEKVKHSLPAGRQWHFGVEMNIDAEIVAQGAIRIHDKVLSVERSLTEACEPVLP